VEKVRQGDGTGVGMRRVDCDVHPNFVLPWAEELSPYMSREWGIRFRGDYGGDGVARNLANTVLELPHQWAYPRRGAPLREDLMIDGIPCTESAASAEYLLDGNDIDRAILQAQGALSIGVIPNSQAAGVIGAATNDWLADRWLSQDSRWRGTIIIAPQDPVQAAAEIRRCAVNRSFVGVQWVLTNVLMGHPVFNPIYEAAAEFGLPIVLHGQGAEGIYPTAPSFAGGIPSYHLEYRTNQPAIYQAQLSSVIANGIFEKYPNLKVVFTEVGYAWVPDVMWKMDAFWKTGRDDTPWITKPPSEYIFDHCRFTTQPFFEPRNHKHIAQMFEMFNAERTLMFATDYPHWNSEEPVLVEKLIPEAIRQRVLVENAIETYGDRLF
jgi:predicted TIM-barrel fold metal-dependent hydrolase